MTRRQARSRSRRQRHGLAWRLAVGAVRGLVSLTVESYSTYRQAKQRLEQDRSTAISAKQRPNARSKSNITSKLLTAQMNDAIAALTSLGFRRVQAETAITQVAFKEGMNITTEQLIKLGLKTLAK